MRHVMVLGVGSAALVFSVLATALTGCEGVFWETCTLIGCTDGVTVEVTGATSPSLRFEAVAQDGYTLIQDCGVVAGRCIASFERFTPGAFTLTITGSDDYLQLALEPAYDVIQPNGPDCDPACRVADIHIALAPVSSVQGSLR